jgi:homoserine kinase
MQAGALCAFTSGAGPSILALCADRGNASRVASALTRAAADLGVAGESTRLNLTDRGAHVVS